MPLKYLIGSNIVIRIQKSLWILMGMLLVFLIIHSSLTFSYPFKRIIIHTPFGDALVHFISYGLVMFSFCCSWKVMRSQIIIGAVLFSLGILLELNQIFTWKNMGFELDDILANTLGITMGFFLAGLKQ